jgi:hypothetical protein
VMEDSVVDKEFAACGSQRRDDLNRSKDPPKQSLDGAPLGVQVFAMGWTTRHLAFSQGSVKSVNPGVFRLTSSRIRSTIRD